MILQRFVRKRGALFFLALLSAMVLMACVQPYLPGQRDAKTIYNDSKTGLPDANRPPDKEFWFGTNSIGQDLWARVWTGIRNSMYLGGAAAAAEILLGFVLGILWGYVGRMEFLIKEMYYIVDNIPQTLVLIVMSYIWKPGIPVFLLALSLTGWTEMARITRNQVLILRDKEYNLASRCMGSGFLRMLIHNFLPFLLPFIALRASLTIPEVIGREVLLTYIGIGLPAETVSLGNLIYEGRAFIGQPALRYQMLFPLGMLIILAAAMYSVGNAVADAADPMKERLQ